MRVCSAMALNQLATVWAAQNPVQANCLRLDSSSLEGFGALAELPWLLSPWYPSQVLEAAV